MIFERQAQAGVVRGRATVAAGEDILRAGKIRRLGVAARHDVLARIDHVPAARRDDRDEILHLHLEHGIVDDQDGCAHREIAEGQAIRLRGDAETQLVDGVDPTGARTVADDDVRPAGNVFGEMPLVDPRLGIGVAADAIVDQQSEGLVLVELGERRLREQGEDGDQQRAHEHRVPPVSITRNSASPEDNAARAAAGTVP